jgi:hypothetical protein
MPPNIVVGYGRGNETARIATLYAACMIPDQLLHSYSA